MKITVLSCAVAVPWTSSALRKMQGRPEGDFDPVIHLCVEAIRSWPVFVLSGLVEDH